MTFKFTNNLTYENYDQISEIDKFLKKDPNNIDLLMRKAFIYFKGFDDEGTIETYNKVIQLDPKNTDAYFWLAYYNFQIIGNSQESIRLANEGIKINPNRADLYGVIALALIFWRMEDLNYKDEILQFFKTSLQLEPTNLTLRISLIEYLINIKEFDEAKKEIENTYKYLDIQKIVPSNDMETYMETYYERFFTWRTNPNVKKYLEEFKIKIDKSE